MLVLSRKQNEALLIGHGIYLEVMHVGRDRVKLGILAPAEVRILRAELAERELEVHHGSQ